MGTLTVKENLMFSANLRLPPSTTTEERKRRVDETIAELGLTECQNSKVTQPCQHGQAKIHEIGLKIFVVVIPGEGLAGTNPAWPSFGKPQL